jgi:predicted CXXCH cytochrome family protein
MGESSYRPPRLWALAAMVLLLAGCDPVTRHKALSTIFDGVPQLPPAEELCRDELTRKSAAVRPGTEGKEDGAAKKPETVHLPYAEKRCSDCHSATDKDKNEGFVVARLELCFVCHTNFFKGEFMHGPAAVGDCQACHEPHNGPYPALLKEDRGKICAKCHREERLSARMHNRFNEKGMDCVDCHDPHSGTSRFFLK